MVFMNYRHNTDVNSDWTREEFSIFQQLASSRNACGLTFKGIFGVYFAIQKEPTNMPATYRENTVKIYTSIRSILSFFIPSATVKSDDA